MRNRALVALLLCLVLPAAAWAHDSALSEVPGGSITAHVGGQPVQEEFHGDPIPPGADVEFRAAVRRAALARVAADSASITPLAPSLTWCGIETATDDTAHAAGGAGPSIKLVYAHAADQPDHFAQYADLIQGDVATIFGSILSTSGNLKSVRFDMGTACGARFVDVVSLTLPRTRATYQAMSFSSRITAMRSDLHPQLSSIAGTHDFLVYADGLYANDGITGVASLYDDDQPGAANASNTGGLFGFVLGNGGATFGLSHGRTAEHELSHNLGAVQDSAPHSTLAGHCFENYDVMCYADGGTSGQPSNMVTYDDCPNGIPQPYDCHQDDYFSANPARGSYLATHWNVFNSVFLCPVAACITDLGDVPPTASVALSPTAPAPGDQVTFDGTASRDDGGPIATYSWDAGNDGTVDGTQPTFSHTYPDAGSYTVKLTVTDAGGKAGSVTRSFNVGTVVAAPPAPVVAPPPTVTTPTVTTPTVTTPAPPTETTPTPPVEGPVNVPIARPSAARIDVAVGTALAAGRALIAEIGAAGLRAGRAIVVPFTAPGAGRLLARLRLGGHVLAEARLRVASGQGVRVVLRPDARGRRLLRTQGWRALTFRMAFFPA